MQVILGFPIELFGVEYNLFSISISKEITKPDYYQHNHGHVEFHYIAEGAWKLTADNDNYVLRKGSAVLIPASVYHRFTSLSDNAERFELAFKPCDASNRKNLFYFKDDNCIIFSANQLTSLTDPLIYMQKIVRHEGKSLSKLSTEKIRAMASVFIAELYSTLYEIPNKTADEPDNYEIKRQSEIDSFFSHHYTHAEPCESLSSTLNVSKRQLTRIIKQSYGVNYRQKLNEVKLQNSLDLLYNTDMTVSEIAAFLGYSNPANFTAFFKKQTGKTPLKARFEHK